MHTDDLAEAYRLALLDDAARGAYNVAADPVLDGETLGAALEAAQLPLPAGVLRAGASAVVPACGCSPPSPAGSTWGSACRSWTRRAIRATSGGSRGVTAVEAFEELFDGLHDGAGLDTPPLDPRTSGPLRVRELVTGVGSTSR